MYNIIQEEAKKIVKNLNFESLRDKTILITGASGLIGLFLLACLQEVKEEYNIEIFSWINNPVDPLVSELFYGSKLIQGDITTEIQLPYSFDCIIHAAGYGQPSKFMEDKIKTIELNTSVTKRLLTYLKPNGKFFFVSTSELYSGLDYDEITEEQIGTTNTNHPRSCYIESKRCGEAICYAHADKYDIKIVRLSLAYGPGIKKGDNRVLNSLIQKGLDNNEIKLLDSGDAIRTYCYITDVVEMFWNILLFGKDTLYNVGGVTKLSILELAQLIGKELNKPVVTPVISNGLVGNPKLVNISNKKYLTEFNKTYFTSLEEGLTKTINWQKQL